MGISMEAANALESAIDGKIAKAAAKSTRANGTVTRIDKDGTPFVRLDGSDTDTPAARAAAAVRVGEHVGVTVSGGSMAIDGNWSAPATDDTAANAAQSTADAAIRDAGVAASAAAAAVQSAEVAEQAAQDAQDSLQSVVQGATTVEKAVSVMQTALEAVVDYDPSTDTTTEYFWHDANGAHVLGDTSGYRNDIDSSGMDIKQVSTEDSVAHFGASGSRIGKVGESNLRMDYHSMELLDQDSDAYFTVRDMREGTQSIATVSEYFTGDGSTTEFAVHLDPISWEYVDVYVNGVAQTISSVSGKNITLASAPSAGAKVRIQYGTTSMLAKYYTVGIRNPQTLQYGPMSYAEGMSCVSTGFASHAEGSGSEASGMCSHSEGNRTYAVGEFSHSEGFSSGALGKASHAEGSESTASGEFSHAEGESVAAGTKSHSEGDGTYASGTGSHAEGGLTLATASDSHAEGYACQATGKESHAEGNMSYANGRSSHAQNLCTISSSDNQTTLGKYNVEDANGTYAAIIGNGTADSARKNALAVDWDGIPYHRNPSDTWGSVFDLIYPVGSIYMSVNSTDPGTLFGGTWQRITGRFLLAATDNGAAGGNSNASIAPGYTGGEAAHTLTAAESGVPAHGHGFTDPTYKTSGTDGTHSHTLTMKIAQDVASGSAKYCPRNNASGTSTSMGTVSGGGHGHTITKNTSGSVSNNTAANATAAHNNMPPYLAVYVWKRTA